MKKIILLLLAGGLVTFNSCTKTGPQGPRGYDGNANVIGTDPFTPVWGSYDAVHAYWTVQYSDNDITTDVVDHGIVEVFKSYGTNEWSNLPDISGITSTVFNFYDNGFQLYVQNSDGSQPASPAGNTYRVVVISPSQRMAHPTTNWKNYSEAMAVATASKTVTIQ